MNRKIQWLFLFLMIWFWHDQTKQQMTQSSDVPFVQSEQMIYMEQERKLSQQVSETVRDLARSFIHTVVGIGDWISK